MVVSPELQRFPSQGTIPVRTELEHRRASSTWVVPYKDKGYSASEPRESRACNPTLQALRAPRSCSCSILPTRADTVDAASRRHLEDLALRAPVRCSREGAPRWQMSIARR